MRNRVGLRVAVIALVVAGVVAVLLGTRLLGPGRQAVLPPPTPPTPTVSPSAAPAPRTPPQVVRPGARLAPKPVCTQAAAPFDPVRVSVAGVTRGVGVIPMPRAANGATGVPPLSSSGKWEFAWDQPPGLRPGTPEGNVLMNAHTWPDGSALGNALLANLEVGGRLEVYGAAGQRLCYRVTERVEVTEQAGLPRYYDTTGPPQLGIVVCSGTRLGPGRWSHRTVWFAQPV